MVRSTLYKKKKKDWNTHQHKKEDEVCCWLLRTKMPNRFLTSDNIAEIKGAFLLFDRNGDGVISGAELEIVLRALGERPTPAEMTKIIR